jgi:biopolymer transport protein ExbD
MKCSPYVSLLVVTILAIGWEAKPQTPALQKGVSVQMAVTNNAQPVPAADEMDAWVVAVTADGRLFFGANQETAEGLLERMKVNPRKRDQNLYIKADARAPFSTVKKALYAAREGRFENPVLLTTQHESVQPGTVATPRGIAVKLQAPPSGETAFVRLSSSERGPATLNINSQTVSWTELDSALKQAVQSPGQTVQVEANDAVAFADVMRVLDAARASKATVSLPVFNSL